MKVRAKMKNEFYGIALAIIFAPPVMAQDLVYSDDAVSDCLGSEAPREGASCAGASAAACMADTPGSDTTVGMGGCFDREWQFWDGELNEAYGALMMVYLDSDAEAAAGGWNAPSQVEALRAMQRAWITYRDARCDFERSQWGGGTGGGPATVACLMDVTAEQTILLRDAMDGLQ
jgi:uncharacterized protein YecT (DUF1311 family)